MFLSWMFLFLKCLMKRFLILFSVLNWFRVLIKNVWVVLLIWLLVVLMFLVLIWLIIWVIGIDSWLVFCWLIRMCILFFKLLLMCMVVIFFIDFKVCFICCLVYKCNCFICVMFKFDVLFCVVSFSLIIGFRFGLKWRSFGFFILRGSCKILSFLCIFKFVKFMLVFYVNESIMLDWFVCDVDVILCMFFIMLMVFLMGFEISCLILFGVVLL